MYTKKDTGYYVNRHSCFLLTYHVVLVTKYRKPVLQGKVKELVYGIIRDILDERGYTLKELNGELDHVHILFDTGPEVQILDGQLFCLHGGRYDQGQGGTVHSETGTKINAGICAAGIHPRSCGGILWAWYST